MTAGALNEELAVLIELQGQDRSLDRLRQALEDLAQRADAFRNALEQEKRKQATAKERARQLAVARKEKEMELAEKEEAIKKHQSELNAVKTNEAFKALLAEIERGKQEKNLLEDAILDLMEQAEALQQEEKQGVAHIRKLEEETAARLAELQSKRKALETEQAAAGARRQGLAERLAPEVISRYENLRARRQGMAVVPVEKNSCGGCHMALPPQLQVEVRRGGGLVCCPTCQRILYLTSNE